jgi:hypothetical protein
MNTHDLIAATQAQLDAAVRELKSMAVDFTIPHDIVMERRAAAQRLHEELLALDRKALNSFWRIFKFW